VHSVAPARIAGCDRYPMFLCSFQQANPGNMVVPVKELSQSVQSEVMHEHCSILAKRKAFAPNYFVSLLLATHEHVDARYAIGGLIRIP
jgi:hypothetical protein